MFEYARMLVPSHAIVIWSPNPKKSCSDFDLSILRSYQYIPVYAEYNSVYTMRLQNQGQLSYFVLHGSILVLVHASIHHP